MGSSSKDAARQLAYKKFKNINTNSVYWPWLDYGSVYSGLIDRIGSPDLIWQSTSNLCGMASAMNALAWDDPYLYAFYVCELYRCGAAYLGYGKSAPIVKPSKLTRSSKYPPGMAQVDWIALASLRDHLNGTLDYAWGIGVPVLKDIPLLGFLGSPTLVERLAAINYPDDVVQMLTAVGYKIMANKADWTQHQGAGVAAKASGYYSNGCRVLLLINSSMLASDDKGKAPGSMISDHWVRLNSKIEFKTHHFKKDGENGVRFQIYNPQASDKKSTTGLVPATGGYLRHSSFVTNFYGFIAARK